MNASRAIDIYYVVHIDYILYIDGLKPIEEGVIYECLQLQQLHAGLEPAPIVVMGTKNMHLCRLLTRLTIYESLDLGFLHL